MPFVEGAGVRGLDGCGDALQGILGLAIHCIRTGISRRACGRAKTEKTLKIEEKTEGKITREKQACKRNLVGENIAILAWLQ